MDVDNLYTIILLLSYSLVSCHGSCSFHSLEAESGKKESECSASNNLYMVQIYRSPRQAEKKIAVVFVSLYGKAFLKVCVLW